MKKVLETVGAFVALAIVSVLGAMMLVMFLDPECGPDGYSQTACMKEMAHDVVALVRR